MYGASLSSAVGNMRVSSFMEVPSLAVAGVLATIQMPKTAVALAAAAQLAS